MNRTYLNQIKSFESPPKIVNIFSEKEIKMMQELYAILPESVFNKSKTGEDLYGLFHESFSPLPIHVDSGFNDKDIIYKQAVTPLSPFGDTVVFKNKWYGRSTSFTIDKVELEYKPKPGQNDRSCEHLGEEEFDKEIHKKYLTHIDINNLKGLKVEQIYNWKVGETLIMDRSHIHSSSSRIKDKKLGLTTFTKK